MDLPGWIALVAAVFGIAGVPLAGILFVVQERKGRQLFRLAQNMQRELATLRKAAAAGRLSAQPKPALEAQRLAWREREAQWRKTRDMFRGVKWILRNIDFE